ncbi:WhiB family transcriptional regulator [Mycobacterium haemophilum]
MGSTPHTTSGAAQAAIARPFLSLVPEALGAFEAEPELEPTDQWQDRALCAQTDPEAFFPEKGGSTREAKKICLGCEVRHECLEYALAHDERFGIWGGLSERERRRLKRGVI